MAEPEPNPNPIGGDHEEEEGWEEHEVLFNPTRHEHKLRLFEGLPTYTCDGCKEYGASIGYRCAFSSSSSSCCNFTLHAACATVHDEFQYHPLQPLFKFRPKTLLRHNCDACQDVLKGFVFETELKPVHLRLHPLCMLLPEKLNHSGHANHQLKFVKGDLKGDAYACSVCNKNIESGGWRYRCEEMACNVTVDLSCCKIDFYELSNSGIARIAPVSRRRRFRSALLATVKCVAGTIIGGISGGVARAAFDYVTD